MQTFYTHCTTYKGRIKVRGWKAGRRFQETVNYKPRLFVSGKSEYKSLYGEDIAPMDFASIYEAKEFVKQYKDVSNFKLYGSTNWEYNYLYDNFHDTDYDPEQISVANFDIEVEADEFPDPWEAKWPINAITILKNGRGYTLGTQEYTGPVNPKIKYIYCKTEEELLEKFIQIWINFDPDVITGWNIDYFDVPYIINRIRRLLSENDVLMLSPWKIIQEREVEVHNKKRIAYEFLGITSLDYIELYKKFSFKNVDSYRLDNIAFIELGKRKIDYSEYESLNHLAKTNWNLFIEYNQRDVILIDELDEKLSFLQLVFSTAYDILINYSDTFTTVRLWEILMDNYMMDQKIVAPIKRISDKDRNIVGAYVKDPQLGSHDWIVNFDLNSLYPSIIMQYNISPETLVSIDPKLNNQFGADKVLEGYIDEKYTQELKEKNQTITALGTKFTKDKVGIIPQIMRLHYEERKKYKKLMLQEKQKLEDIETEMKKRGIEIG